MKSIAPKPGTLGVAAQNPPEPAKAPTALNIFRPLPANGQRCEFTGLGHTRLYRLLCNPGDARTHVRVASLRKPGQTRAKRLYHVGDLVAYLSRLADEQRAPNLAPTNLATVEADA